MDVSITRGVGGSVDEDAGVEVIVESNTAVSVVVGGGEFD
jgi:hypothetical protein